MQKGSSLRFSGSCLTVLVQSKHIPVHHYYICNHELNMSGHHYLMKIALVLLYNFCLRYFLTLIMAVKFCLIIQAFLFICFRSCSCSGLYMKGDNVYGWREVVYDMQQRSVRIATSTHEVPALTTTSRNTPYLSILTIYSHHSFFHFSYPTNNTINNF